MGLAELGTSRGRGYGDFRFGTECRKAGPAWITLSAGLTSACLSRGIEAQEQPTDRTASQQLQATYAPPRQWFIQGSVSF